MLQQHIILAIRNLRRRAFFSFVNIAGLAVGLASCWLIGLFVWQEKSYDAFLPHADRICAVALDLKMGEEEGRTTNTPPPVGPRLTADFPEIEQMARTFDLGTVVVRSASAKSSGTPIQPTAFNENMALAADSTFLELFGFPMAEGVAVSALDQPGSIVLTQKTAEKYFGPQSAMGQALVVNDRIFTVTGIVRNLPKTSTVQFDFLLPMADFKVVDRFSWSWIWLQVDTWVRLQQPPTAESLASLEARFPAMVQAYAPAAYERIGQNFAENLQRGDRYRLQLLPLKTMHLDQADLVSRLATLGDGQQVRMFSMIGALILLLACVNFMNLSTARSVQRAQEVSIRKALGSNRSILVGQFLAEAFLFCAVAMVLAGILAMAALPLFNWLTGYVWTITDLFSPGIIGLVLALPLLTGFLGGLYPAFYLSRYRATETLKKAGASSKSGHTGIRSGLVVFQFSVSIVLMLSSFVVYEQLDFAQNQSNGLQREHVLILENTRHLSPGAARESFRQQLLQWPEVLSATHSTHLPSLGSFGDFYEPEQGSQSRPVVQNLPVSSFISDMDLVPTLGIEVIEGHNFSGNTIADSTSVLLNETAVKAIGWEQPVGKWLRYPGNGNQRFQVIGVVRDFHTASVKMPIEAMAIFHQTSQTYQTPGSYMALRLRPGSEKTALAKAAALWKTSVPDAPFEYDFLDASFARLYRSEAKTGTILGVFTGLALFIGCLGLFALAAFTAEQRTKEIGIRKVLGASVAGITGLLAKDFLKLVLIAILIATPIAWYAMQQWLADFAYRIAMKWWMFAAVGGTAVCIACLTVGFQSVKAALANPVKALRSE